MEDYRKKNTFVSLVFAIVLGALGFLGIGHFYVGRFRRGIILLISGWLLIIGGFIFISFWSMSGLVIPPPGHPQIEQPASAAGFLIIALVLFLGFGGLWVWQILDARAVCRTFNTQTFR